MNAAAQMGTRTDPVWQASQRAAALVMRSAWKGPPRNRLARLRVALNKVLPDAAARFDEALALAPAPRRAQRDTVHRAAAVGLSNALLDHYMALGRRVYESRSDPRVVNVLEKAGLTGLGDEDVDEAEQVMKNVACNPATVGVVSGIVGAFTYGIGGAVVGAGGTVAQQQACPTGTTPAPVAPAPTPPPAPAPSSGLPAWVGPVGIGLVVLLGGGLIVWGATQ
jgi:hypothetical protein